MSVLRICLISIAVLAGGNHVAAQDASDPGARGLELARMADQRDSGWGDFTARMRMELHNAHGETSIREIRSRVLEVDGDGDKSLTIFDTPTDVRGTAFLSYSHALKPDEQWLFLPALKRVKRISSANKSGPFMGSEFAYEDLSSDEVEKFDYKYLGDEQVLGEDAFVIERIPRYEHSGYASQKLWLSQKIYRPLKIEFYDRRNELLKTATYHGYEQYLEKYWRAARFEMVNHRSGKSTVLHWSEFEFGNGLNERDFDRNALKRAR